MNTEAKTIQAHAWVDGVSRGDPGETGFGLVFRRGDQVEENRDADRMANQAVDLRQPPPDGFEIETA